MQLGGVRMRVLLAAFVHQTVNHGWHTALWRALPASQHPGSRYGKHVELKWAGGSVTRTDC